MKNIVNEVRELERFCDEKELSVFTRMNLKDITDISELYEKYNCNINYLSPSNQNNKNVKDIIDRIEIKLFGKTVSQIETLGKDKFFSLMV